MSHVWSQEEGADRPFAHADIGFLLGGRDGRLLLITAFALVGRPSWALVAVPATAGAALVARLVLEQRPSRRWQVR